MAKKKQSLLLKRSRSITNDNKRSSNVNSLKPQKTRQLIRRFHILQKSKFKIFKLLSDQWGSNVSEDNYLTLIKKDKQLMSIYNQSKEEIDLKSPKLININESDSIKSLVRSIGEIDAEVDQRGGLKTYQTASTLGQSRGGDSSKKLMEWLTAMSLQSLDKPTALEIGCLSSQNLISTSKFFKQVTRIDLRSQELNNIVEQDFMKRPLPKHDTEKFDLISCSLVINFVPTALERGEMLKRIRQFLKSPKESVIKPLLFLVLPLPCVANSRYLDNDKLDELMNSLGFTKLQYYEAKKVAYWLWEWDGTTISNYKFDKKELHSGANRNNFCIVIN